jgi:Tol biopolymer transport system component
MFTQKTCGMTIVLGLVMASSLAEGKSPSAAAVDEATVQRLAGEVRSRGWIAFAARSEEGDWDLFLCRPDGSHVRNITQTPADNEFSPQFSRDGGRLLYRRMPRKETIDNNHHGTQGQLVLSNSDGSNPQAFGGAGEYPWASWSPDGKQIACLSIKGISFIDLAAKQVLRKWDRKGFFQQMTWSPDGKWLCGVANAYGTGWSIARMEVATGAANAVNRVDCCTPDWFPDSRRVIFSWRPPGQGANQGYGWTQLWMADAEGESRSLVYGEDGRHVYGGHVSPDGKYVLFTGNMREDGDPGHGGAPMGLMRLSDAPLIGGASPELRKLHPEVGDGPRLTLPVGWEPCWTFSELPAGKPAESSAHRGQLKTVPVSTRAAPTVNDRETTQLTGELHQQGWLVFSAKNERGDWDLFLMRPDGTERRPLTNTRELNEAGARFSPDGKRLLYYRMPKSESVDNNTYGTFELVVADSDGRNPTVYGREFPWASWGPDGKQVACLTPKGIQIVDLASRKVGRRLARQGVVSQLVWSPDGKALVGTANGLGPFWNIGRLSADTGHIKAVSETDRYNCTPDWLPDSQHVLYARGIIPQQGGRAELWVASGDGQEQHMLYAEEGRHVYGACASPDGRYLLFTRSVEDLGKVDHSGTTMAIIRAADTPMRGDAGEALRKRFPAARSGPRLDLGPGWEPHWTFADIARAVGTSATTESETQ